MMRDLIGKLTELEATAPKAKKMLTENAVSMKAQEPTTRTLKDVFAELSESIAPGTKPLAIMDPKNQKAGIGVLSSPNPGVQNILKNLDPKDVQIMMTQQQGGTTTPQAGQPTGTTGATQGGQGTAMGTGGATATQGGATAMREDDLDERDEGKPGKNFAKIAKSAGKRYGSKEAGERVAGAVRAKLAKQGKLEEEGMEEGAKVDRMVKHIEKSERKLGKSKDKAEDIAWATANKRGMLDNKNKKKVKEADIPSTQGIDTKGAGLGAGRSATTLEGKTMSKAKPDFLDMDKDGNKKEPMKKAVADKKKKTVKEGISHRISAARHEGRSHGLRAAPHCGKNYDDLEEAKAYHEGYKDGLDECYGQGVYEAAPAMPAATVGGMAKQELDELSRGTVASYAKQRTGQMANDASAQGYVSGRRVQASSNAERDAIPSHQGMKQPFTKMDAVNTAFDKLAGTARVPATEDEFDEGNLFTGNLAKARSSGAKSFDLDGDGDMEKVKETAFAFEAWDNQLSALLNEGLSVSVSKGQQNSPDSVTITAQDQEADQLLQLVKHAGLGLFGDEQVEPSSAMSIQPSHGEPDEVGSGGVDIDVVDGHDGIMGLMQKLSGIQSAGAHDEDYADEEGHEEQLDELSPETLQRAAGKARGQANWAAGRGDLSGRNADWRQKQEADKFNTFADKRFALAKKADAKAGVSSPTNPEPHDWYNQGSPVEEEEHTCNECGMMEAQCGCSHGKDQVDEVESEDQQEFEVAENAPDSGAEDSVADEDAEAKEDADLAGADADQEEEVNENFTFESIYKKFAMIAESEEDDEEDAEEEVTESEEDEEETDESEDLTEWANQVGKGPGKGSDAQFTQDIDFMTKVIAGGLNKPKSTGQTTIPVVASQMDRLHDNPNDWATLAGIKKS